MKIIATSDWHLGNLFHGNDRLQEHRHFFRWLLNCVIEEQPDALLVAGDVFDNGNPSAAAQSAYYELLADMTKVCPDMQIVITAGNHDSANRLEAPRVLLSRHRVEVRGNVRRVWNPETEGWQVDWKDLMIPVTCKGGDRMIVLAAPYLRSDVVQNGCYSEGVNNFLRNLTERARALYPGCPLVMMAHMYAKGAEIAPKDASEKIVVGGQEEVNMEGWENHPDYFTCGHIHKRQHVWGTGWARYTGSVLPMSFAEKDYTHGVDLVLLEDGKLSVKQKVYTPQHKLRVLPEGDEGMTLKKLEKLIKQELAERVEDKLDENFDYVVLKVKQDKVNNDEIKELENLVNTRNAVLCKIQKMVPMLDLSTIGEGKNLASIDDILNRNPMDTLKEAFAIKHKKPMSEQQEIMLQNLLNGIKNETTD
jgi:exonuclease SbcD